MHRFQPLAVQILTVYSEIDFPPRRRVRDKTLRLCVSAGNKMPISPDRCKSRIARSRHKNRAPFCDFNSQSSSCYSSGDLTSSSQVHLALTRPDRFAAGASRSSDNLIAFGDRRMSRSATAPSPAAQSRRRRRCRCLGWRGRWS